MDVISSLAHGFSVALQPYNLLACFAGVFVGTLIGVLPGIGPVTAMALLLPVTLSAPPEAGIIMMAGIYYGSMYGGSTTSILVNIPGEAASVVTCLDGHEMAKQGRAGPALGIAALGSFFAGTVAIIALMLVAPTLAQWALKFGPAEYFSLMVLGLTLLSFLTHGSMAKALLMAAVGVVLGLVGGIIGVVLLAALFEWGLVLLSALVGANLLTDALPRLLPAFDAPVFVIFLLLFGVGVLIQARALSR
jgi:putative tricarboxylic transport membrane protein